MNLHHYMIMIHWAHFSLFCLMIGHVTWKLKEQTSSVHNFIFFLMVHFCCCNCVEHFSCKVFSFPVFIFLCYIYTYIHTREREWEERERERERGNCLLEIGYISFLTDISYFLLKFWIISAQNCTLYRK